MRIPNVTENGNVVVNNSNTISSQYIINRSYIESDNQNLITNTDTFNSNYNRFSNDIHKIDSKSITKEKIEPKLYNKQYKLNNQKIDSTIILSEENNQSKNTASDTTWCGNCTGEH